MTPRSLPPNLQEELAALTETGLYATQEAILIDAVRTLLAARPDLRQAIGCRLYEKGRLSLGRAAEWTGLTIEEMKEVLHQKGIRRQTEEDPAVIEAMARKPRPIDLWAYGIDETQAADLRARLATFVEDWERPEMDVYDDYDGAKLRAR